MEPGTGTARSIRGSIIDALRRLYLWFYTRPLVVRIITNQFHRMYYHTPVPVRTWENTRWLGRRLLKCPLDLWIYQELFDEIRPDVVVECGTAGGGSAWYFAGLFDLIGNGCGGLFGNLFLYRRGSLFDWCRGLPKSFRLSNKSPDLAFYRPPFCTRGQIIQFASLAVNGFFHAGQVRQRPLFSTLG